MDAQGIDMEALSINAFWYAAERDSVAQLIKMQNESSPSCALRIRTASWHSPQWHFSFPTWPLNSWKMPSRNWACEERPSEARQQGTSCPRRNSIRSEPRRRAQVVIFMHPQGIPELDKRLAGNGRLSNVIGNPLETTIFLSHLIFDGTLDHLPGPQNMRSSWRRLSTTTAQDGFRCGCAAGAGCSPTPLKKRPTEYLRKEIYVDSLIFSPEALRHLVAQCGVSQIMIGTDFRPFPGPPRP